MNKKFFSRFLMRSMVKRLPKTLSCMMVLSLSTTLVFYALSFQRFGSKDVEKQLRDIGPNMLVLPGQTSSPYLDRQQVRRVMRELKVNGAAQPAAFLYKIGSVEGKQVVVAGVDLSRMKIIFPYLREVETWSGSKADLAQKHAVAWMGTRAADVLGARPGRPFTLTFIENGKRISRQFTPEGSFATGDTEDDKIFVDINTLQNILHMDGKVSLVAASLPSAVSLFPEDFKKVIENKMKGHVQVRFLHALSGTQASFVQSVSRFLWIVSWILLLLTAMGISATFMSIVYERMQEMALLKTLGAGQTHLLVFFLTESVMLGAAGGFAGLFLGIGSLSFVFRQLLEMPVSILDAGILRALFISFFCAIAVTVLGSALPLLKVVSVSPAAALKGE